MVKKKDSRNVVSSKVEITKSKTGRSDSLKEYHANIKVMADEIVRYAVSLSPENLLSVKMAVMEAMRLVERRMKDNEEG